MFGISTFAQSPFASLGGTAYPVSVAEALTLSDSYTGPALFSGIIADSIALADSDGGGTTFDFFLTTAENYSLDDRAFGVADVLVSLSESLTLTNTQAAQVEFNPTQAELINYPDQYGVLFNAVGLDEEDADFTDVFGGLVNFKPTQAETFTLVDTLTGNRDTTTGVQETVTLTDAYIAAVNFVGLLQEQFSITDSPYARGWFKINDDQTVTWNAINSSQTTTWQNINDTQNPNWIEIDNNQ